MTAMSRRRSEPVGDEACDVVVVGSGSAGAALAARLSESGRLSVLLLEAGGADTDRRIHIPAAFSQLFRSDADWDYWTTPQEHLDGRRVYWPRGKVLGGSSSLNAMMWVRGFAADYDGWAQRAGPTWSWDALRPLFIRVERTVGSSDSDHGTSGPVSVEPQRAPRPHTATFLRAVQQAGYVVEGANSLAPQGFTQTMVSQHRGARASTATAYLAPARRRPNLTVRTGAHVTKVVIEGGCAVGVEYRHDGVTRTATARGEVVLSGGAVNTPHLLMLSGIGPGDDLRRHGIDVVVDAPEVGLNLADHLIAGHIVGVDAGSLKDATRPSQLVSYLTRRTGMLTSNVAEAYGFVRSSIDVTEPDLELLFAPVAYVGEGLVPPPRHGVTVGAILLQPRSTGTVTLGSVDPMDPAVIDPLYLSDPDGADRRVLLAGLRLCQQILDTPAMTAITDGTYVLPEGGERLDPDERAERIVEEYAHTLYHPVGTARMGSDVASVVDPQLRVRGVSGLRVADASVMPTIIRGHTNAPSIVIGERAADLVLAEL
ncbi:GMC family oxidoreductase N-terminal domain-containing protein [Lapillicoccus sp.]|uniref:GMC family oxidoreductase n=1 Tax=Lapillicoccus sp. TaxID=1909287 RepID=UPI003265DAA3